MGRGRASLAAIASTAPFVGILASLHGIGSPGPSEAMMTTALGLLVALMATWLHSRLCRNLEMVDTEMFAALLELANSLSRQRLRPTED
jgi:biopolymer transport protein ExbB/TolQ